MQILWQWNWLSVERKKCPQGKEIKGTKTTTNKNTTKKQQQKKNKQGTFCTEYLWNKARSHTAMAHFSRLIVNTASALTLTAY